MAAVQDEPQRAHSINSVLWRNWTVNRGANVASVVPAFRGELTAEARKQLYTDIFYIDPANLRAIDRTLKLAAARQIPVFWVLFPFSARLQSLRDQSTAEMQHEQFVRSLIARFPGTLTVLDARRSGYPDPFFADATHLNRRGGIALSRAVATEIASRQSTPAPTCAQLSWIVLDRVDENPDHWADALEDLDQSRRILAPDHHIQTSSR